MIAPPALDNPPYKSTTGGISSVLFFDCKFITGSTLNTTPPSEIRLKTASISKTTTPSGHHSPPPQPSRHRRRHRRRNPRLLQLLLVCSGTSDAAGGGAGEDSADPSATGGKGCCCGTSSFTGSQNPRACRALLALSPHPRGGENEGLKKDSIAKNASTPPLGSSQQRFANLSGAFTGRQKRPGTLEPST